MAVAQLADIRTKLLVMKMTPQGLAVVRSFEGRALKASRRTLSRVAVSVIVPQGPRMRICSNGQWRSVMGWLCANPMRGWASSPAMPTPSCSSAPAGSSRRYGPISATSSDIILADRGYRGHNAPPDISGQKRGVTPKIQRELRRRAAVKPVIGHLKAEHRMGRNYLWLRQGDAANAVLAAAGYNSAASSVG